jgi:hypothetical protein
MQKGTSHSGNADRQLQYERITMLSSRTRPAVWDVGEGSAVRFRIVFDPPGRSLVVLESRFGAATPQQIPRRPKYGLLGMTNSVSALKQIPGSRRTQQVRSEESTIQAMRTVNFIPAKH